jgi:hypothetical protein
MCGWYTSTRLKGRMPALSGDEGLPERRHITLLLRLVLDQFGHLVHGEVLDLEERERARFRHWATLANAAQRCLARVAPLGSRPSERKQD